ncbi:MAG: class I SAM-dependent methyltransferase [Dermatophilaceae bacterium]
MNTHDVTIASYDSSVASYLAKTPSEPSALARWLADFVGDEVSPGARVLEVGSAGGVDAALLRERGLDVQATDAAAGFVDYLRGHGFPDAIPYDLCRDDPPPGPWDIVFANAVLPHVPREELVRVLRRLHDGLGGETVLVVSIKAGDGQGWTTEKLGTPRWYTYWRAESFHCALREAGWVVEQSRSRSGRFDDWISVVAVPERGALVAAFDERAEHYRRSQWHRDHAEHLIAAAQLTSGSLVVDAAAGTGFVTRRAAAAVGPTGRVIAVDLSEAMLQILAASVEGDPDPASRALAPIEGVLGDATELPLPDASVDAVLCGAGLTYMPVESALAEWHRVLRPGGLIALATLRTGQPPAAALFRRHAQAFGLDLIDPTRRLGTPQACEGALTAADFVDVSCTPGVVHFSQQDLDRAWPVMERMCRGELIALPSAERNRLRASYLSELDLLARTDPQFTIGRSLYSLARRP